MNTREQQLASIAQEISACQRCSLYKAAANPVPGEGNPFADLVFIGEAPGYYEDQQWRPFVGQAGRLLEQSLASIGLSRKEVFISNVLHHRPPGNRDPLPEEVEACKGFMLRQLEIIQPKILSTLGRYAMNIFLPEAKISRDHGTIKHLKNFPFVIFPLYHPAAALRSGSVMTDFKKDFEKLGRLIKLEKGELIMKNKEQPKGAEPQIEQMELI